jgi:integrase
MSTRNKWLYKSDGNVKIYAPISTEGKGKYYRIVYRDKGKYRHTTATTEAKAKDEAGRIQREILSVPEPTGAEFIQAYLDPDLRGISGNTWGLKHTISQQNLMKLYIEPVIGEIPCGKITNDHLKKIVRSGKTFSTGEHLRRSLGALIRWGKCEEWIAQEPSDLLKGLSNVSKRLPGAVKTKQSGESNLYVNPDEIPTHSDVAAVAKAAAVKTNIWWYELLFNLAAYSGVRLGEIIDLDISHIDLKAKTIRVEKQCLEAGGRKSRELPKMAKQRTTVYPTTTPAGYPLAEMLAKRIQELRDLEQSPELLDGSRRRLLFPNKQGSWLSQGTFSNYVRLPAQEIAGWTKDSTGKFIWNFHSLRHVFCSYYLGELRQEASDIAICAGHSSTFITLSMYVGSSRDAISKLSAAN